jgi:hypothetical protein
MQWLHNLHFHFLFTSVILALLSFLLLVPECGAQQPFFPAAVPLAVRSTYFSAWDSTTSGSVYSSTWPTVPLDAVRSSLLGYHVTI